MEREKGLNYFKNLLKLPGEGIDSCDSLLGDHDPLCLFGEFNVLSMQFSGIVSKVEV